MMANVRRVEISLAMLTIEPRKIKKTRWEQADIYPQMDTNFTN